MNSTAPQSVRIVAVTGAGSGIGRATARAFADDGAHVVAIGRRSEPLRETAAGHCRITPLPVDITAEDGPQQIVQSVSETYGRLDVLVNNAGIVRGGTLGKLTPQLIAAQVATNLVAPILLAQAALPLLEAFGGVIVNVSTAVGQRAWPGNSIYAATKVALELLTRSWAVELAPRGIRVVAVAPGAIDTPIGEHQGLTPERMAAVRQWQLAHTPLARIGRPEEVAWAIIQLAAPAASFVTGVVLPVDGGAVVA
ncbi:SDR family oxidoreductase [Dactylosporangium aurantiacum]|uniref:SDR family oxidoreductase n=1 Tax=Dactylosporangium aurantiacum TaxID=35754 RepID=A0A9Q9IR22_9ACTN|nr:SDR family oxidoreductase [Dactylosporangium aurantiacum]MDG6106232.1 SDR family NAD(P)-dependent oxidoreductase [Dactylosporangium aurantiacum]UWZ58267.1 SDR family oxidoreductase [Dactylosporangium aurantiacum]